MMKQILHSVQDDKTTIKRLDNIKTISDEFKKQDIDNHNVRVGNNFMELRLFDI